MKKVFGLISAFLSALGEINVRVFIKGIKDFWEFLVLTLKLIWSKTVKLRNKLGHVFKYLFVLIASPFVKMSINLDNMKKDIAKNKAENGKGGSFKAFLPYLSRFIFGKRGLMVTAFNYGAPILSFVFFFNVISFATSTDLSLKLTVNGNFLGYIENEQVYLDAEAFVSQRVNYFGSTKTIEMIPEFKVTKTSEVGEGEFLDMNEVANTVMEAANFVLVESYGFFIDGELYGAVLPEDIHLIDGAVENLFNKYRTGGEGEEVRFLRDVSWNESDLFLRESVVDPQKIIKIINATKSNGQPNLSVITTKIEEYDKEISFDTIYQNDDTLLENSTRVTQQGKMGTSHDKAHVTYENGIEIRRNVLESTITLEPVEKIINVGTKPYEGGVSSNEGAHYGMFIWPVVDMDGNPVGGISPGQHFNPGHGAIDIVGTNLFGTPVVAGESGTVILARDDGNYGKNVIIQHENGLKTLYAHNSEIQVVEGQVVSQGEQIANLGSTGMSTGPHVHFEVISGNRRVDPMDYLNLP